MAWSKEANGVGHPGLANAADCGKIPDLGSQSVKILTPAIRQQSGRYELQRRRGSMACGIASNADGSGGPILADV
jgi:hypothetical protein